MIKKLFFSVLTLAIAFSGVRAQQSDGQKPLIKTGGNMVWEMAPGAFHELEISGIFDVSLIQGDKEWVKVRADGNLRFCEIKNEKGKLVISPKKGTGSSTNKRMKIAITFRKLDRIALNVTGHVSTSKHIHADSLSIVNEGAGSVNLNLTSQVFTLENKGAGLVKLKGKADRATIRNESAGSIQTKGFAVQHMDIDSKGIGSVQVNAKKAKISNVKCLHHLTFIIESSSVPAN